MASPVDPVTPVPQTATPLPAEVPEPIPSGVPTEQDIVELAAALSVPEPPDPPIRKGVISAVNYTAQPRTVDITLSGSSVVITGVRLLDNYAPRVGHTVLVGKEGTDIWVIGHIAEGVSAVEGWTAPSLASGFTTNGNGNGNIEYRKVLDHGTWKMQWRGSVGHTGSNWDMLSSALSAEFRPPSRRSLILPRQSSTGSHVIGVDFNTDGTIEITGSTTAPFSASTPSATLSSDGGFSGSHNHWHADVGWPDLRLTYLTDVSQPNHNHGSHSHASHHHDVDDPSWISFNGKVEYFL